MTAHALRGHRDRFLAAGFDGYVSKPFRECDLVSEVQRVLAGQRAAGADRRPQATDPG